MEEMSPGVRILGVLLLLIFLLPLRGCFGHELFKSHVIAFFIWVSFGLGVDEMLAPMELARDVGEERGR